LVQLAGAWHRSKTVPSRAKIRAEGVDEQYDDVADGLLIAGFDLHAGREDRGGAEGDLGGPALGFRGEVYAGHLAAEGAEVDHGVLPAPRFPAGGQLDPVESLGFSRARVRDRHASDGAGSLDEGGAESKGGSLGYLQIPGDAGGGSQDDRGPLVSADGRVPHQSARNRRDVTVPSGRFARPGNDANIVDGEGPGLCGAGAVHELERVLAGPGLALLDGHALL